MFSRAHRLPAAGAKLTLKRGRTVSGPHLRLKYLPVAGPVSRATVVVGLAADKRATVRNRLKRRLREILRPVLPHLQPSADLMVFGYKSATVLDFSTLRAELIALLKRSHLL